MKDGIHPRYVDCSVTCGCGNSFETRATTPKLNVEICSACHPFYTGKQKFVDAEGRVKKFENRHGWNKDAMDKLLSKKEKRVPRKEKITVGVPKMKKRKAQSEEGADNKGDGGKKTEPKKGSGSPGSPVSAVSSKS